MGLTVAFSVVLAVAIFIALAFRHQPPFQKFIRNASLLAILEGLVRLAIFLIYVAAIALHEGYPQGLSVPWSGA